MKIMWISHENISRTPRIRYVNGLSIKPAARSEPKEWWKFNRGAGGAHRERNAVHNNLLNFQLREIQFKWAEEEEKSPAAARGGKKLSTYTNWWIDWDWMRDVRCEKTQKKARGSAPKEISISGVCVRVVYVTSCDFSLLAPVLGFLSPFPQLNWPFKRAREGWERLNGPSRAFIANWIKITLQLSAAVELPPRLFASARFLRLRWDFHFWLFLLSSSSRLRIFTSKAATEGREKSFLVFFISEWNLQGARWTQEEEKSISWSIVSICIGHVGIASSRVVQKP
jgi:hypothetical protein